VSESEEPKVTLRLKIKGKVQGVGFRFWAVSTARRFGVSGWVRNHGDGSVEALAHGSPEAVNFFAAACSEGPRTAQVEAVDATAAPPFTGSGFEQRPSVERKG